MLRKIIFRTLYLTGIPHLFHLFQKRKKRVPILLFHDVSPDKNVHTGSITPEEFEEIIILLKRKYKIMKLADLAKAESNSCFITFDDGMKNFLLYAYPILQKHHVPVTLFIPSQCINSGYTWNLKYFDLLAQNKIEDSIQINVANANEIQQILATFKHVDITDHHRLMNWQELEQLSPKLIDIQSHSHSHDFLTSLTPVELELDLETSKSAIELHFSNSVNAVAYPMGDYNDYVMLVAKKYYKYGFITSNRCFTISKIEDQNMKIPRFHVDNPDKYELYSRINEVHQLLLTVKDRLPIEKNTP